MRGVTLTKVQYFSFTFMKYCDTCNNTVNNIRSVIVTSTVIIIVAVAAATVKTTM